VSIFGAMIRIWPRSEILNVQFAQIWLRKEGTVRGVGEGAMIYTLTVILLLVGAAASAIMIIAMWGTGWPVLRRWRRRPRAS
jgi:hypothetical protein